MAKPPKRPAKWILCTKWFTEDETVKPTKVHEFWTPIGDREAYYYNRTMHSRVFEYDSKKHAVEALREIMNIKEGVADLMYYTCEVRYVPNKIKVYDKRWFDKYVIQEHRLAIEKPKTGEATFQEKKEINP